VPAAADVGGVAEDELPHQRHVSGIRRWVGQEISLR